VTTDSFALLGRKGVEESRRKHPPCVRVRAPRSALAEAVRNRIRPVEPSPNPQFRVHGGVDGRQTDGLITPVLSFTRDIENSSWKKGTGLERPLVSSLPFSTVAAARNFLIHSNCYLSFDLAHHIRFGINARISGFVVGLYIKEHQFLGKRYNT
jgi:hypothetical protein